MRPLHQFRRWKLGALAGLAVVLVTLVPQCTLWVKTGSDWRGAYAYTDTDELAYSAYLNSLIQGKPRRNNPEAPTAPPLQHESIFSIQFIPSQVVAFFARLFGLSASTVFILLIPLMAFISSMAVFWLLLEITNDSKTAALGLMLILLCGLLASGNPIASGNHYGVFSFLRRYTPSLAFPLVFVFCVFIWRAYTRREFQALWWALAAGLVFGLLVYSYFYLWTAVAAWFFCFTTVWLIARPNDRKHVLKQGASCCVFMIATLIPYAQMLGMRMRSNDSDFGMVWSHAPDPFRLTELLGVLIISALVIETRRRRLNWRSPIVLFTASCALVPFVVFNQQILTGRSLQPFHYEQFVVNYLILVGCVITDFLFWKFLLRRPAFSVALALVVGLTLAVKSSVSNLQANLMRDEAIELFRKLDQDARGNPSSGAALFDRTLLSASSQTTCSSLPLLWSLFTYTYGAVSRDEEHERLFQQFFYLGVNSSELERRLSTGSLFRGALFGLHRVNRTLTQNFRPISSDEIRSQVEAYSSYVGGFSQEHANRWPLSYVILRNGQVYDLTNLDRWYVRDEGEVIGRSIVYRVRLRSKPSQ